MCLVDVLNSHGNVIHTFPITLGEEGDFPDEAAYKAKALEAAAHARLVPDSELPGLTARMHTSRGGQMQPFGDSMDTNAETKFSLEQAVREQAYFLWERDGCQEGRAEEYWQLALEQHRRERAYVLWQQEGGTEGHADGDWQQVSKFQEQ
jgi:hypothetical protein